MSTVAVVGASGFVGSRVVERLSAQKKYEVMPFIHSSGNAWQLARTGRDLTSLDLLSREAVFGALRNVDYVVNCSRGSDAVMLSGLKHLLAAARAGSVKGFVHLSSVAIYGDPPHPQSHSEDAPAMPSAGTYGWIKLQQDNMVMKAAATGLPATILCPPNIGGPFSGYLEEILNAVRKGTLAVVEQGNTVFNIVDVDNLAYAVEIAMQKGAMRGERYFITDDGDITWARLIEEMQPLVGRDVSLKEVPRDELRAWAALGSQANPSISGALKHLVSSDVRQALRKNPLLAKVDAGFRGSAAKMGSKVEDWLRKSIEGPLPLPPKVQLQHFEVRLSAQQLRGVRHSSALAKRELGYAPPHTFSESMDAFRNWYRATRLMDDPAWDLLRLIY